MEDKQICCLKLVANVVRGGIWQFVYDTNRPTFLERVLVGLGVNENWQVWVQYCSVKAVIWSDRDRWVSPM